MKKLAITIVFICCLFYTAAPQIERHADSLLLLIENTNISNQPELLNQLSQLYRRTNPEKAKQYALQALKIASDKNQNQQIANAYKMLGFAFYVASDFDSAYIYFTQSHTYYQQLDDKAGIADCLKNFGNIHLAIGTYDSTLYYYNKALKIKQELNDSAGIAVLNNNLGVLMLHQGKYKLALKYLHQTRLISTQLNDKYRLISSLGNIAHAHYKLGEYKKSVEYNLQSLRLAEEIGETISVASAYTNIGNTYDAWGNTEKAFEYHNKALLLYAKTGDINGMSVCYNNLGIVYLEHKKNYKKALTYLDSAMAITQQFNSKRGIALIQNNIGEVFLEMEDYQKALHHFNIALQLNTSLKTSGLLQENYINIGNTYLKTGQYALAEEFLLKSYELASNENITERQELLHILTELYQKQGNYRKALEYQRLYCLNKDTLFDNEKIKQISEMQTLYDFDKQKAEIALLCKNQELDQLQINRQLLLIWFGAFGIVSMFLVFMLLYNRYKIKSRTNQILIRKNEEITLQNEEILQQKEEIAVQAERLKVTNQELMKLSVVASHTDNAIIIMDTYGNFEWINDGFTRLWGYDFDELKTQLGKNILEISTNPEIENVFKKVVEQQVSVSYDSYNISKNSKLIWVTTTITPVINGDGEIEKLIAIDSNISELKEAEQEIHKQHRELKRLNATKDKFFSIIAHDLKNPFNALVGITELLAKDKQGLSEKRQHLLSLLHQSGKETYSLLENLLEWSRTQTGKIQFSPEPISLNDLVNSNIVLNESTALHKKIKLESQCESNIGIFVDRNMIDTVLRNLINNALKFTEPNGEVIVKSEHNEKMVKISIEDSGVGMDEKMLDKLFRLDEKISTKGTNQESGTGLGLIICKEFVEQNAGKILVESTPGKGSVFSFTVPIVNVHDL